MRDMSWSHKEKKLARALFDAALDEELAQTMAEVKRRAAAMSSPEQMWALQDFLRAAGRELDQKYDYRYSVLLFLFARLVREGRIGMDRLQGLAEDKLEVIRRIVDL